MKQPLNIILLGEPASGKATQSKLLLKKYKLVDLDMGKELRKLQLKSKNHKPLLDKTISVGKLAPTGIVKEIFKDKILSTSNKKGILFDGTPKMLSEAKLVVSLLKKAKRHSPIVIYLSVPASEIYKRANLRKEYVRGKWSKRPDDSRQAIKNRLAYYRTSISAVTKFLKNHYPYKQINGVGSINEVHLRIAQAIEKMA